MLTDLADACRKSGLPVVEQPGWRTRGHGQMSAVRSIICHHTAGPAAGELPSLTTVRDGRPGLAGPLAQLMLGRSGTVYVIAAGLCWHAGVVFSPPTQGNAYAIGIEAEATGTAPWPPAQYAAYARLCRALVDHYGLAVDRVLGHKEVASPRGRKVDPNFDCQQFRAAVSAVQEDDMFTDSDRALLAATARRVDVGFARDQVLTALGVADTVNAPAKSSGGATLSDTARAVAVLAESVRVLNTKLDTIAAKIGA